MHELRIVDYGSQYTHLIKYLVRTLGYDADIVSPDHSDFTNTRAVILSGSPYSAYEEGAPQLSNELANLILNHETPTLAICYGMQLLARYRSLTRGYDAVNPGKCGEFGRAKLRIKARGKILKDIPDGSTVWMSHGDSVIYLPPNSQSMASSADTNHAVIEFIDKPIYCLQFHPEVSHTEHGKHMLSNFLDICSIEKNWEPEKQLKRIQDETVAEVGERHIFAFISGGNDSSVLAAFLASIFPEERLHFCYVRGLAGDGDLEKLAYIGAKVNVFDARNLVFKHLQGLYDPEDKRKAVRSIFIDVGKKEIQRLSSELGLTSDDFIMAQGTIYPDLIESGGTALSDKIKTHHNIGIGECVEPFKEFFKEDIRKLGRNLGVNHILISQHPEPGPRDVVRVLCSDEILPHSQLFHRAMMDEGKIQELCKELGYRAWVLPIKGTGVQGDRRSYGYTVGLVGAYDPDRLFKLATDIPNNFRCITRVVYAQSPKRTAPLGVMALKKEYFDAHTKNLADKTNEILAVNLRLSNLYNDVSQAFTVISPLSYDCRGYTAIIRAVRTRDFMTATPFRLPRQFLANVADEILKKCPEIQLVAYDLTSKPPGTIEWE